MITSLVPSTWQDLQSQVARILSECGFAVEVERLLRTARGKVNIDVYCEEKVQGRTFVFLCECKYWKAPVNQNVIHGFRTVMGDTGANKGYIISIQGFQSGSFSAADLTNVDLVTWEQFQELFEATWLRVHFAQQLKSLEPIINAANTSTNIWLEGYPDSVKAEYSKLKNEYDPLGLMAEWFIESLRWNEPLPRLPIKEEFERHPPWVERLPTGFMTAKGYREILEIALLHGQKGNIKYKDFNERRSLGKLPRW